MIEIRDDSAAPGKTQRPTPTGELTPGKYQITVAVAREHAAKSSGNISLYLRLVTDGGHWLHEYVQTTHSRINEVLVCLGQQPLAAGSPLNPEALVNLRGWVRAEIEASDGYRPKLRVERGGWLPAAPTGDEIPF